MDKIIIEGGHRLEGRVKISGAKNSILPILAATLLADDESIIENIPHLKDIDTMLEILTCLGVKVEHNEDYIKVNPKGLNSFVTPYNLVKTMRASICVLGPLISKLGKAKVSLPGGCVIGPRPIDLHLKGLKALGAKIDIVHGYIEAYADRLKGCDIFLGGPYGSSALATCNIMMAAVLSSGTTTIDSAACEPEVVDLTQVLIKMGARISGVNSHTLKIEGVNSLKGVKHCVISDRIEAGTFMVAGAITKGKIEIENANPEHLGAVIDKLREVGTNISYTDNRIVVETENRLNPVDVTTLCYPGFPTDMQAQMMALMSLARETSVITERVYPERFMHVSELKRMGADITLEGANAIIKGVPFLTGAQVMASDLRASAALVLAGLIAHGETVISRVYHLDRGYENLEKKLSHLGAKIWREGG